MTPEAIAKQIAERAVVIRPNGISVDCVLLIRDVTAAITDAYEHAAVEIEACPTVGHAARRILATRVRELKG